MKSWILTYLFIYIYFFQLAVLAFLYYYGTISVVWFGRLFFRILKHQYSVLLCHNLVPENISSHIHILIMKGNCVIILRNNWKFFFKSQLKTVVNEKMLKPTGRVVGIIKRNWRPYCGMLSKSDIKEVSREHIAMS